MTDIKTGKMACDSYDCKRKVYLLVFRLLCCQCLMFGRVSQVYTTKFGRMSRQSIRDTLLLDIAHCGHGGREVLTCELTGPDSSVYSCGVTGVCGFHAF